MKCLRKNGADAREANQYATSEDFDRIFAEDMDRLHQLSFLLTRDQEKAEKCFVTGLEDSVKSNRVFREWARSWAERLGANACAPDLGPATRFVQHVNRFSASFAFASDVAMLSLGGYLKKKESLSARLGDVLSSLYLASMVVKHHENQGRPPADQPVVEWACRSLLYKAQEQLHGFLRNFPVRWLAVLMRLLIDRGELASEAGRVMITLTLMEDLAARGLLEETLVVIMSEMGRTPRVNASGGRDHWTYCYSVLLAGAGIRGGTVYGASDAQAAYVKDMPASTADICATIYECLGIDPDMPVHERSGRPVPVANGGKAIREILA